MPILPVLFPNNVHNILVLEDGMIVESGNHQELFASQGRYSQLGEA